MKEIKLYSLSLFFIISLFLTGCGSGGSNETTSSSNSNGGNDKPKVDNSKKSKITTPKIVSIDSTKTNSVTLFWLRSSETSIKYEVHLANEKNFTISSNTLKKTLVDANEADIKGLSPATQYWVKIVAKNSKNKSFVSDEMSFTTATFDSKLAVDKSKIKDVRKLNITTSKVQKDKIILNGNADLNSGDILIGTQDNPYLRRVISSTNTNGTIEVKTEDIAISDVISDVQLSSKTVLFNDNKNTSNSSRSLSSNRNAYKTTWKSGRFSIGDNTQSTTSKKRSMRSIKQSNGYFDIVISKNDEIKVTKGKVLEFDISADMKIKGINEGYEFEDLKFISITHSENDYIKYINPYGLKEKDKYFIKGKFRLITNESLVSTKPYTVTFEAKAKDKKCSDTLDSCDTLTKEINIKFYVVGDGKFDGSTNTGFDTYKEFTNNIDFDFTPTLELDHTIEGSKVKYVKAVASGKLVFNVDTVFKYEKSLTREYSYNIFSKTYKSVYVAGVVPIYQEVKFTVDALLVGKANGSIEATSDLDTSFEIQVGAEYEDGQWKNLTGHEFKKDYIATVKTEGGVNLEVRLIPNIEIKFYKVASAGLSVEPWATGELKASATAKYNTDFESQDVLGLYKIDTLSMNVGIEGKISADLTVWKFNLAHYPSGGGEKTIFDYKKTVFSLPTIAFEKPNSICKPFNLKALIENGVNNPFDYKHTSWRIFPSDGSSITANTNSSANISFDKKDEYEIYFIGNSQKLGSIFGKQYESIKIDTRDCNFSTKTCKSNEKLVDGKCVIKTCRDDKYNCPVCSSNESLNYKADGSAYCVSNSVPDTTKPTITSSNTVSVNENQINALTVVANDDSGSITYSLSGSHAKSFNIDKNTGKITFKSAPDFETQKVYRIIAIAKDSSNNASSQSITINIKDVDENIGEANVNLATLSTGQTKSYEDYDDGYYKKGRVRAFTRGSDIVIDHLTNLQWQDNTDAKTLKKSWSEAKTYCSNLTLGGYSDWRLPSVKELLSIVDNGKFSPAINDVFKNTNSNYYWSNTSDVSLSDRAWSLDLRIGAADHYSYKFSLWYIRCVRNNKD